ncbi:MAG TPA: DHA2 family efflux MFS transporter permease subunit, partial [Myxococcaceae bacterium]|nr:DHA2 family efflux MFS transporter permease subunit [Myxococcaceae bacterium]
MAEHTPIQGSKLWITIAAMLGALMAVMDISIVNVALSDIRASFGTPLDQIAWVSTGYAMANVTVIPLSGWLQRRFGFRNYYAGSLLMFTAASALCALAWNLPSLVVFRILQGIGGGAIIPTSQNILFGRYPHKEHGTAGALFALGAITGPLLGPTIGGKLIDVASWHWIFLINVPVGLLAAWVSFVSIKEPHFKPTHAPIDGRGITLLALGMVSLQYVLEEGNRDGWFEDGRIVFLACTAAICLVTFVVHELETPHPVVDFRVFKNVSYSAATALNFLVGTALFAGSFLFSLFAGTVLRYEALDIGMLFLRGSWIQLLIMPLVGRLVGKVDNRGLIAFGILWMIASLWLNGHLTQLSDTHAMTLPIFVRSLGLGFCFVPLSVVALSGLKPSERGSAAGLFNLTRELGGSIGTAWMSTIITNSS